MDEYLENFLRGLPVPQGIENPNLAGPPRGERVRSEGEYGSRVFYTMLGNNVADPDWAAPSELPEDATTEEKLANAERCIESMFQTIPLLVNMINAVAHSTNIVTNWASLHNAQHGFGGPPRF